MESEGRWRQNSGLTNRNHIRLSTGVRLQYKPKPNNCTELCIVNMADIWRERNVWYPGRSRQQADMKKLLADTDEWIRRRIRAVYRKHWKRVRTRYRMIEKFGIPKWSVHGMADCRKGIWRAAMMLNSVLTAKEIARPGISPCLTITRKLVKTEKPPCTERYARWCERSAAQLMGSLLLDFYFGALFSKTAGDHLTALTVRFYFAK